MRQMLLMEEKTKTYFVKAEWDPDALVWFVADTDVPGLATEAPTIDDLLRKLRIMVPEMLELNGVIEEEHAEVPFSLLTHSSGISSHC